MSIVINPTVWRVQYALYLFARDKQEKKIKQEILIKRHFRSVGPLLSDRPGNIILLRPSYTWNSPVVHYI